MSPSWDRERFNRNLLEQIERTAANNRAARLARAMCPYKSADYHAARRDHAALLRIEGLTSSEIAIRLSVSRQHVGCMIYEWSIRLAYAMREARYTIFTAEHSASQER